MHKRHTKVTLSQEQEVKDMLERGKVVPAISRETGISKSKIYEIKRRLPFPASSQKSPLEVTREWWEALPNAESVLAVRAYIHQVEVATGLAELDSGFHYGPAEEMVLDSISARDGEVETAIKGYTELTEAVRKKATSEDGWTTTIRVGKGWVRTVEGMVSKEVRAKAHELIEALKPYSTL